MCAYLRAWFYHGDSAIVALSMALMHYGKDNYPEMFNVHLRRHLRNNKDFFSCILDLIDVFTNTQKGKAALITSNAIKTQVNMAVTICRDNADEAGLVEK